MKHLKIILLVITLFSLQACVNQYEKFYKESPINSKIKQNKSKFDFLNKGEEPRIEWIDYDTRDKYFKELTSNGWLVLGFSGFEGVQVQNAEKQAKEQAKKVNAKLVVMLKDFSKTSTVTNTVQEQQNMNTNFTNQYGMNVGNALTTYFKPKTYVSQVDTFKQYAYFLVKQSKIGPKRLGVSTGFIPVEKRKKLKRNTGVYIKAVLNGSPAFNANIFPEDVIIKVNNKDVSNPEELQEIFDSISGYDVNLVILRDGEEIPIKATLSK